ncbi:MAG: GNAT family N-acetyltransferase [Syntrophorhabdales bacterium]|jgi:GNAT superfamily N-acetyltransferase
MKYDIGQIKPQEETKQTVSKRLLFNISVRDIEVGHASFYRISADAVLLTDIRIASILRGRGYGRRLLAQALTSFEEKGIKDFYLEVHEANAAALKLYHRLGFKIVGKKHSKSHGCSLVMCLLAP